MNAEMFAKLSSERNMLIDMLDKIPLENVIDRFSLENRLEEVQCQLENINKYHVFKKARLTFRGKPVIGSEAISANFAAKVTKYFSDAINAVSAGLTGDVNFKGRIPDSDLNQLMITGMAVGSFGFEFELPRPDTSDFFPEQSIVEKAVDDIRELFEISANGSDDDLSDIVEEIHPRAVLKIYEFLKYLDDQDARCGLEFDNKFFRFDNKDQLSNALKRINKENISETIITLQGVFKGVLPVSRTFEFKKNEEKYIIKGKISLELIDPDVINREWLNKGVEVKFTKVTVGESKPKYILKSVNDINILN